MKFPTFKKLRQRIGKLSSSNIAFVIIIFLLLVFTISSIAVFVAHRGYLTFESQDMHRTVSLSIGDEKNFLYHEIEVDILYFVWKDEYSSSGIPIFSGISIVLIDGNSNKIADEQQTLLEPNKVIVCTTRNFELTIDQLKTDQLVRYKVVVTTYYYHPYPVILKLFLVFSINWLICIGVILYERYSIRKKTI
ncbi:MAG: hypothetical protein V3V41_09235 [Candidatus Heimdallarchaeota archaeon]